MPNPPSTPQPKPHRAELPGSNTLTFDSANIVSLERQFIVPWEERGRWLRTLSKAAHPELPAAKPVAITIEPALGENARHKQPTDWTKQTIEYEYAIITVRYQVDPIALTLWPSHIPLPPRRDGTTLELRLRSGGEFLLLEGALWEDNPNENPQGPVPDEDSPALRLFIPQTEFEIVWHRVLTPPAWLESLKGCVNMYSFLGCPPETLLFQSYSCEPEIVLDPDYPVRWAITCQFLYRAIVSGGYVFGWNHEYRRDGIRRVLVRGATGGLELRYPMANFTLMFT